MFRTMISALFVVTLMATGSLGAMSGFAYPSGNGTHPSRNGTLANRGATIVATVSKTVTLTPTVMMRAHQDGSYTQWVEPTAAASVPTYQPAASAPAAPSKWGKDDHGLSGWILALVIIGCIVGGAFLGVFVFGVLRMCRQSKAKEAAKKDVELAQMNTDRALGQRQNSPPRREHRPAPSPAQPGLNPYEFNPQRFDPNTNTWQVRRSRYGGYYA
jgi:hypothetical protein